MQPQQLLRAFCFFAVIAQGQHRHGAAFDTSDVPAMQQPGSARTCLMSGVRFVHAGCLCAGRSAGHRLRR
jgi:hypothetical protein